MKNTKKWLALLLAVCMTVSTAAPGGIGAMQVEAAETFETAEAIELSQTAVPRYSSIRITWNPQTDHTYDIYRSDSAAGQFEKITSAVVSGGEYIDENAGVGVTKYYKIKDVTDDSETAAFSNDEATGIEALAERAEFKWVNDPADPTEFAGNTMLSFKEDDIAAIKELSAGTILYKGYQNTSTGADNKVLLGLKGTNNGTAYFGERSDRRNNVGINFGTLISGWNLAFTPSFVGNADSKHAVGYVSPKTNPSGDMFISVDAVGYRNDAWTSAESGGKYGGFMKRCGLTELTIGGFGTDTAVTNGWNGGIDYVIITSEVLSQNEVKEITTAKPSLEPEKTAMNARAIPGYSSIKLTWDAEESAVYTISRSAEADGDFVVLSDNVTASPYVDDTVAVGENWYYQIQKNGAEEAEVVTAKMAAGIDALKKYAQFKWVNDGNTVFNGSKGLKFTGDQIAAVKELTSGTILTKGYLTSAPASGQVLLGFRKNTTQAFFGTRSNKNGQWGWELGNLITGWNISLDGVSLVGTSSSKHVTAYVSPEKENDTEMLFSFDGITKTGNKPTYNYIWKSGTVGGFMKQMDITALTIGAFVADNNTVSGAWNGGIDYVYITDEVLTQDEIDAITASESIEPDAPIVSGKNIGEMFNGAGDNSWVFTGGADVQGGFAQVAGARNYIGHFEEYVRGTLPGTAIPPRQRYTINTAKAGQTLKDVVDHWSDRVTPFNPKAVAYMVGAEDYSKDTAGIADFKVQLKALIDKSLAMRENKGFAVIQKPYVTKDVEANKKIEAYCAAVDAVVAEYKDDAAKLGHIVVVDHYTQTKAIADFTTKKLNADGTINNWGHLEIGRQFCEATVTIASNTTYPTGHTAMAETAEPAAEVYSDLMPAVTATENALNVTIPAEAEGNAWKYTLKIDAVEIKDSADAKTFTISDLPAGKAYTLTVQTADGKTQLQTVAGKIEADAAAVKKTQELDANQQRIQTRMQSEEPMTWLFMGDSITHSAMWTDGYDGIAQSFEKFLKDDLGRTDDVVINTAVSGAMTHTTLDTIEQRLTKYDPDVVSIMLGTNDCTQITPEAYKTNLKQIVDMAKEKGAIVILRTPTPGWRDANLPPYIAAMKEVADADPELIYSDQFTEMKEVYGTYSYLFNKFYLDNTVMGLHPGANGHLIMTRQFIEACGLWTDDSHITNLFYQIGFTEEAGTAALPLQKAPDKIGLSVKALAEAAGRQVGSVTITATDGTRSYTTSTELGKDETILTGLKGNTTYKVDVKAYLKDSAKILTFTEDAALSNSMEADFAISLSNKKVRDLKAGAEVGTLSVSSMAPEGTYTYTLCTGDGAEKNEMFKIDGDKLLVATELTEKETYSIRVKAVNGAVSKEQTFEIYAVGSGFIFEEKDITIQKGTTEKLTDKPYAEELMKLEEGTFIVQFTSTATGGQSLISVANSTSGNGNDNRHFHLYINTDGTLGYEIRNNDAFIGKTNAIKVAYKGQPAKNTVALKADKETGKYKLFANGKLVATLDASSGYRFIKDITGLDTVDLGGTIRAGAVAYQFGGTIHYVKGYSVPLSDEELIEITGETKYEPLEQLFHSGDATGSNYFRIPALITTKNGTVIAAIDARFGGTCDSNNNIDTAVRRSTDGGKTWEDAIMPLHFDDFADDKMDIPLGKNTLRVASSASFIDPQLLYDEETDRVYVIADAMPSGYGSPNAQVGSGYKKVGDKRYRMLKKAGENDYNYSIHEDNYIYDDRTGTKTEYSVNANFEILQNDKPLTVKQKTASYDPTTAAGAITESVTNVDVAMNIMYDSAAFTVFPTTYLYMKYSDDQGKTWSDPIDLNAQVKGEQKLLIVGPGRGLQIKNGDHKGRLLIPTYDGAGCSVIYSDDHGKTWKSGNGPNVSAVHEMTESQIVEMPDGSLKVFARTYQGHIATATSLDGGETWSAGSFTDITQSGGAGTQLSVINYSGLIEGKPAVIMSTPVSTSARTDGRIKIGLITDTGNTGVEKYAIEWKYDYEVDAPSVGYSYSCLTELPNHNVSVLYEKYDSWKGALVQSKDIMAYEEFSIAELCGQKTEMDAVEIIPVSDGHGTVSQRSFVNKGTAVTITATPDAGYRFVNWTDKDGKEVSTEADYTVTVNETVTYKANFVKIYHVTVIGAAEDLSGDYTYNTKLTVTAKKAEDGKVFAGWEVNGQLLSTSESYTFFVGTDLDVSAVYEDEKQELTPQAYLQAVSAEKAADGKYDLRYLGQLVVPAGYTIKQAGLVWRTSNNTDNLVIGGNNVKVTQISKISNTYQFSVTIKGVPEGREVPGRIFAQFTDPNGQLQDVIYSEPDVATAK